MWVASEWLDLCVQDDATRAAGLTTSGEVSKDVVAPPLMASGIHRRNSRVEAHRA